MINNNVGVTPGTAKTVSTVVAQPAAPAAAQTSSDITLPTTGPEDMIFGTVGVGSVVAAGVAYANSRRELMAAFLKR